MHVTKNMIMCLWLDNYTSLRLPIHPGWLSLNQAGQIFAHQKRRFSRTSFFDPFWWLFLTFFHMCCAFISKKHLALLVAGCFFLLFAFTCLSIPDGRIGLFSNPQQQYMQPQQAAVYSPLISGCSLTPSPPGPINSGLPDHFSGQNYFYLFYHCYCLS